MVDTTLRSPPEEVSLATFVHAERKTHNWSQKQLADKAGVSACSIIRIERAQIEPERNTLECVLGALGWELELGVRRKGSD